MIWLLAHWKAAGAALAAVSLLGYVGVLNVNLAAERAVTARLGADLARALGQYATCSARLQNILERESSDATVPDDLDRFVVPDEWLFRLLDGTATPGD